MKLNYNRKIAKITVAQRPNLATYNKYASEGSTTGERAIVLTNINNIT